MTGKNGAATLTELQQAKMEVFALRHQMLQQQLQANLTERAAMIRVIEEERPGYKWRDDLGGLVNESEPEGDDSVVAKRIE